MLLFTFTITTAGIATAAVYNEKRYSQCHDENGKFIEGKNCDRNACGCLFHQIEEFVKGVFGF